MQTQPFLALAHFGLVLALAASGALSPVVAAEFGFQHPGEGRSLDRVGTLWAPYVEWSLENTTFDGNPFDVTATATFVHEESGEKRTTGIFYDGGTAWKFRFSGTRTGTWSFTTSSPDEDLDGKKGKVVVGPNPSPNVTGFITNQGNKWARPTGQAGELKAFVPQLVMYAKFFEHRFLNDMTRAPDLTFGVCLKVPASTHYVFYKEDAGSIEMDLSEMAGQQGAVAVDAKKPYHELRLGSLAAKAQIWAAPHRSDWAIAVGNFK